MRLNYSILGNGNFCLQVIALLISEGKHISCIYTKDVQVIKLANENHVPCFQEYLSYISYLKEKTETTCTLILNPTLAIPKSFFELGYFLVHCQNSLLPLYSCDYAPSLVILNCEKESGVTWHTCEGSLMNGRILLQVRYAVKENDTALTLSFKGLEAALDSFVDLIQIVESEQLHLKRFALEEQVLDEGIINFDSPAEAIKNFYRACNYGMYRNPFSVPKVLIGNSIYVIGQLEITDTISSLYPGRLVESNERFMQISTRDKIVCLSGFYDMDQKEWSPHQLCEHFGIHKGDLLALVNDLEKSVKKNKLQRVRSFESETYIELLEKKKLLDLPFLVSKRKEFQDSSYNHKTVQVQQLLKNFPKDEFLRYLIAGFYTYLYRLNNFEDFSLDIVNEKTLQTIVGIEPWVVAGISFQYSLKYSSSIQDVFDLISPTLDTDCLAVNKDIYFRIPELNKAPDSQIIVVIGKHTEESLKTLGSPIVLSVDLENFEMTLSWSSYRFKGLKETIPLEAFLTRFVSFLDSISSMEQKIEELSLLTPKEHQLMVYEWNQTEKGYPSDKCYMELFRQKVEQYPERIAVKNKEIHLTYRNLLQKADTIGSHLLLHNVKPQDVVAVFMKRDVEYWLALLGIWDINAVYVPIDPGLPASRIATILSDSKAALIISDDHVYKQAVEKCGPEISILNIKELLKPCSCLKENILAKPGDLAYIIYTSGSTGNPKGAMIEQQGMINHTFAKLTDLNLSNTDTVAQIATQSFDISIWQFITPLLVGGISNIFVGQDACEPEFLIDMVERQLPQIVQLVPSHMMVVLDELEQLDRHNSFKSVRWLFLTGEGLNRHICKRWFDLYPHANIMNGYGATETSDDATHFVITKDNYIDHPEIMPVSGTVMNSQLYVLDKFMNLLPYGVNGEIYIGGDGVGRGYLNDPIKTTSSFLPDPYHKFSGKRIYRTGDIGVFQYDGVLDYLGRKDNQVKLRGHRIEIGEIEGALLKFAEIAQAAALVREDFVGQKRLIAYLVLYEAERYHDHEYEQLVDSLKLKLIKILPEYMVPNDFVFMAQLPTSANGKLDKKNLPKPSHDHIREREYVPPENDVERYVIDLWKEVLGLSKLGVTDHFFKIGGHSLFGMKIMSQIRKRYKIDIPSTYLFDHPTVRQLSEQVVNFQNTF